MKISNMICAAAFASLSLYSCKKDAIPNPNAPTIEEIIKNPTIAQLNNLVTGAESGMRSELATYTDVVSLLGREYYRMSSSDSRFTQDLLGYQNTVLDNSAFYINNPWLFRYNTIRTAYVLMEGAKNSQAITAEQRKAYNGYAKTIIAYQLLMNLNLTYANGIRTDVRDYKNLGAIVSKDQSLTDIAAMLDEARTDLQGSTISFNLSSGFTGFSDVAGLTKFNRAIAARVAVYRQNWPAALTALNASFMNLTGDLNTGVYHVFAAAPGDILNPLFVDKNKTGEIRVAHPSYATDIDAGDDRINKTSLRNAAASQDNLTSNRDVWVYHSITDPVTIIRNEELILLYAEASLQSGGTGLNDARTAIDRIRAAHGVGPYAGPITAAALLTEVLKQRRFSLFGEGHRWIDLRRNGLLNTLPKDRTNDDIWPQLPLPLSEN